MYINQRKRDKNVLDVQIHVHVRKHIVFEFFLKTSILVIEIKYERKKV